MLFFIDEDLIGVADSIFFFVVSFTLVDMYSPIYCNPSSFWVKLFSYKEHLEILQINSLHIWTHIFDF